MRQFSRIFLLSIACYFLLAQSISWSHTGKLAAKGAPEPMISEWVLKRLNQANEHIAEAKYDEARALLTKMLKSLKRHPYEAALTRQTIGFAFSMEDKYAEAIPYFKAAIPALYSSYKQTQKTRYDLAQLYFIEEQYPQSIELLETWIKDNDVTPPEAFILLANAYSLSDKPAEAIPLVKKAIEIKKTEFKEDWYRLLLSLHLQLSQYKEGERLLSVLVNRFPGKAEYWLRLAALQITQEKMSLAAATYEIAWKKGFLKTEQELLRLVHLFLHVELPERAAQVLTKEMPQRIEANQKHWRLLGNAWLMAREYDQAVTALEKAADQAEHGKLHDRIGRIYYEQQQWQPSVNYLSRALEKGKLAAPAQTHLLIGQAYIEMDNTQQAKASLQKAAKFKSTKRQALQWLSYLEEKR